MNKNYPIGGSSGGPISSSLRGHFPTLRQPVWYLRLLWPFSLPPWRRSPSRVRHRTLLLLFLGWWRRFGLTWLFCVLYAAVLISEIVVGGDERVRSQKRVCRYLIRLIPVRIVPDWTRFWHWYESLRRRERWREKNFVSEVRASDELRTEIKCWDRSVEFCREYYCDWIVVIIKVLNCVYQFWWIYQMIF